MSQTLNLLRTLGLAMLLAFVATLAVARADTAQPLRPQKAYPYQVQAQAHDLVVKFDIVKGYYLYRDRTSFASQTPGVVLGKVALPPGLVHEDEFFGKQQIYRGPVTITIPYTRAADAPAQLQLVVHLQGCADLGICYPPQTWTRTVSLAGLSGATGALAGSDGGAATASLAAGQSAPVSEQGKFAAVALGGSWWILLGIFYAAGLALAFTPCVLPLVPIISGIIVGQKSISTRRAFALSVAYVLGMAFTYTVAGAAAAIVGQQLQAVFQKPWILGLFAAVFVLLALSMFGAFNLQMPSRIQARLSGAANRQRAGSLTGTAVMGVLSSLIVTTCVAPALVGALAVIGQQGDVVRGAAALFALSIGMGTPLLLIGASAGALVPRAGSWMTTIKAGFGVMTLGLAIWMLERVLPGTITLALWALLVFFTGIFLGAFEALPTNPGTRKRLAKGGGVLACLYGALMLIGASLGGESPVRPIPHGILSSASSAATNTTLTASNRIPAGLPFRSIESVAALQGALQTARANNQPVIVDFTADWCASCKEMEKYTFPNPVVVQALTPFLRLRVDVTANTSNDQALLRYFGSYGPPTIAFFDASGKRQKPFELVGFVPPDKFAAHVARLATL